MADDHPGTGGNRIEGRILRHAYLGEARDYLVGVVGTDMTLRVVTGPAQVFRPDERVRLDIPPDACRVLPASG